MIKGGGVSINKKRIAAADQEVAFGLSEGEVPAGAAGQEELLSGQYQIELATRKERAIRPRSLSTSRTRTRTCCLTLTTSAGSFTNRSAS